MTLSTQLQESISSKEVTEAPEQTLTIITPPAVEKHGEEILKDIESKWAFETRKMTWVRSVYLPVIIVA